MQIFELHFNLKLKEDRFFDSFIYEPSHSYEKRLGSLYMVGELENGLPPNAKLLDNLAQVVKGNYYQLSYKTPEKALSETLKKSNEFLAEEVKKENVSWLGNLNFAALSLAQPHFWGNFPKSGAGLKDSILTFTQTGNLKILLIRQGQITDLSKNLDHQDIEPYPLKIFFSVVSGKLAPDDIILVLTKELFDFFVSQNLLDKISQAKKLDKRNIKEILPLQLFNKGEGAKISGICLLVNLRPAFSRLQRDTADEERTITFQEEKKFSLAGALSPILIPFQKVKEFSVLFSKVKSKPKKKQSIFQGLANSLSQKITLVKRIPSKKTEKPAKKSKTTKKDKSWIENLPTRFLVKSVIKKPESFGAKKRLILVLILIFVLGIGFLIFKGLEQKKEKQVKIPFNEIQEKFDLAESFLIIENKEGAESLFKEAWLEILPLMEKKTSLKPEILSLKENIEKNLKSLNNLEKIENPEKVSDPEYQELFVSPTLPENLTPLSDPDFKPDLFVSYSDNLYFLDKKNCKIIKYPSLEPSIWGSPKTWKGSNEHCSNSKSMAIDGSIWILNGDNSITRYHKGEYQETIDLDIFPIIKNITQIKTESDLTELYLLEPVNKRVIIVDKETQETIKQFQSEKFDNLKDFAISDNGEIIYLLNSDKIYKIELK